jgi:hypothetical protein
MSRQTVFIALLGLALPALAQQSANDVEMLKKFAGTWAVDCAKPGAKLRVEVKALTIESDGKRISAPAPMAAFSYFGQQQPPKGFEAALLGDTAHGQAQLVFFAMGDSTGPYLTVEADSPTLKLFGKPALTGRFKRCA